MQVENISGYRDICGIFLKEEQIAEVLNFIHSRGKRKEIGDDAFLKETKEKFLRGLRHNSFFSMKFSWSCLCLKGVNSGFSDSWINLARIEDGDKYILEFVPGDANPFCDYKDNLYIRLHEEMGLEYVLSATMVEIRIKSQMETKEFEIDCSMIAECISNSIRRSSLGSMDITPDILQRKIKAAKGELPSSEIFSSERIVLGVHIFNIPKDNVWKTKGNVVIGTVSEDIDGKLLDPKIIFSLQNPKKISDVPCLHLPITDDAAAAEAMEVAENMALEFKKFLRS